MKVQFVARFRQGQEFCSVEVDEQEKYELEKVESFSPYWIIRDLSGKKLGTVETLLTMQESIIVGTLEQRAASGANHAKD